MEDRIRKFMEFKGISAAELADSIGVQRSNVTHVLKARNKPSFQFIEKLLQVYPDLNAKWLLLGTGKMVDGPSKERTLFDSAIESSAPTINETEKVAVKPVALEASAVESKEIEETQPTEKKISTKEIQDQFFSFEKPIERMIVFYKDQTFKVYNPSK
jgi:transcriptional regulator with XRE-family HTH domain